MDDMVKGATIIPETGMPDLAGLPGVFRLLGLQIREQSGGVVQCTAQLYHDKAALRVSWSCRQPDIRLHPGVLVSPR